MRNLLLHFRNLKTFCTKPLYRTLCCRLCLNWPFLSCVQLQLLSSVLWESLPQSSLQVSGVVSFWLLQILVPPMERQRLEWAYARWVCSSQKLSCVICFLLLWLVFWVSMDWLLRSLWFTRVCDYGCLLKVVAQPTDQGTHYSSFAGYGHLAAGLSCGLSCLAAGLSIGIAGDAGTFFLVFSN